jgi:hypothetical protein
MVLGVIDLLFNTQRKRSKVPGLLMQATLIGLKKIMARKRDFSEIVNLIQNINDDDDKDDYLPTKKPRLNPNLNFQLFYFLSLFLAAFTVPASLPLKFPLAVNGNRDKER